MAGFEMVTLAGPRGGVRLEHVSRGKDGAETGRRVVATLPEVTSIYDRGDGLVYAFRTRRGQVLHATAAEMHRGDTWAKAGLLVPAWAREAAAQAVIQVTDALPLARVSPRVTEGLPPLASPELVPRTGDAERGREGWGWLADRLAPAGRLAVGAALAGPWIEPAGATTAIMALWGEAGAGKSMVGRVCAALFGTSDKDAGGLMIGLNSAAQGITAWLQELSYYTPVLDEVQSATTDITAQMTAIVNGASRKRAGRAGDAIRNPARFGGLAIATSNTPLLDILTHELYDRRLIEIGAEGLWQPRPGDLGEEAEWWADIGRVLPDIEGWAWQAMQQQYAPGEGAREFLPRVHALPMPGRGNIGMILRLAYAGCAWLAEWTGNEAWTAGVWDEAVGVAAEQAEHATNPARDAARAIVNHQITRPGEWESDGRERVAYPAQEVTEACRVQHPARHECAWWDMPTSAFTQIVPVAPRRLASTPFVHAVVRESARQVSRKAQVGPGGHRARVYTVCMSGLSVLAWDDGDNPALPPPGPEPGILPGGGQTVLEAADRSAPPRVEAAAPLTIAPPLTLETGGAMAAGESVQVVTEQRQPESEQVAVSPVYGCSDDGDVARALATAVAEGVTDLTGPHAWQPEAIEAAGWDTHGWKGFGTAAGVVSRDGAKLRVRHPHLGATPQESMTVLADWAEASGLPVGVSVPRLALDMIRQAGEDLNGRAPKWLLPDDIDELWTSGETKVLMPRGWGKPGEGDRSYDRNRSYLPSYTQAHLAPLWYGETFETFGPEAVPEPSAKVSGMWRVVIPRWPWPQLPPPWGGIEEGREVWMDTEVMRLCRTRGITPRVLSAVLAPAHKITPLQTWADDVRNWLAVCEDRPALRVAKGLYQSAYGAMMSEHQRGQRNSVYRPDWGWHIGSNSWCSILRKVYTVHGKCGWTPTCVRVDAVYYRQQAAPPGLPLGDGLGQFHRQD